MKKFYIIFLLFLLPCVSDAQYRIMGYYPNSVYGDYVIVYGYYDASGIFRLSHCRTNALGQDIFSNLAYLDINTCQIKMRVITPVAAAPEIPPPPPPTLQKAF